MRVDSGTRREGVILLCLDAGFVITSKLKESSSALQRSFVSPFVGLFSRGHQEVRDVAVPLSHSRNRVASTVASITSARSPPQSMTLSLSLSLSRSLSAEDSMSSCLDR